MTVSLGVARPRGADRFRDNAISIDPANRRGDDRLNADGYGDLSGSLPTPRWRGGAKQRSLTARGMAHFPMLADSRTIGKTRSARRGWCGRTHAFDHQIGAPPTPFPGSVMRGIK
jgi:hypothetical protein